MLRRAGEPRNVVGFAVLAVVYLLYRYVPTSIRKPITNLDLPCWNQSAICMHQGVTAKASVILATLVRVPFTSSFCIGSNGNSGENALVLVRLHQISHFSGHIYGQISGVRCNNHLVVGVSAEVPSRIKDGNRLRFTETGRNRHRNTVFFASFYVFQQRNQPF